MPFAPGTWLAHYEILEHIGSGGMGDVYRARDNKLNREVALKVLPPHFARDPERIARFRREAQLLAQLNHPNIAAIYNFEEVGETRFLVMELVRGETLRERIKHGPLPMEEALDICEQITEALEHAHEKPIIHRDLKPANVKVTPEGQVKVLDFGLAKAFGADRSAIDPHDAPTGSLAGTLQGTILGTPAYMPPEQARGKEVDKRADIWSFGCVLFELLTGQWAFQSRDREGAVVPADTVQDIIARVLQAEPDWNALPETIPASIRTLLRRCLEKDLKRRSRDATEIRFQIEECKAASAAPAPAATPTLPLPTIASPPLLRPVWRRALPFVLTGLVAPAIAISIAIWNRPAPAPRRAERLSISLPPNTQLAGLDLPAIALSPDGSNVVYVGRTAGGFRQLFLRPVDSLDARPIPGTEGANSPFFSPDGQWIGFFADGKLKKISVSGGAAVTLSNAPGSTFVGASWGPDDTIVFHFLPASPLLQVPAAGGTPKPFTTLKGAVAHRWPEFLPGGKAVLFAEVAVGTAGFADAQIVVQAFPAGERKVLVQGAVSPHYLSTGHLVYVHAGTLMAAPLDVKRLEVTGPPVPILEGVMESATTGSAQFSVSQSGSLVYIPGHFLGGQYRLVWVDRKGTAQPLPAPPRNYGPPRLSPDGRRIAALIQGNVWTYDISRDTLTRLTFENSASLFCAWTPDGKRITFQTAKGGSGGLFWKPADGSGPEERLTTSEFLHAAGWWSLDGTKLAFFEVNPNTSSDIWVLSREGDSKPRLFLRTPFTEAGAMFSPDGRWLAYLSDESGRNEIYVQPYPGPGGKWQISTEGGIEPIWGRNGEIYYRNGDKMMAVETNQSRDPSAPLPSTALGTGRAGREGAVSFSAGKPRLLFEGQYENGPAGLTAYDVTADGQRFLMVKADEQPASASQINVVLNWFEELKRRVPAQ